MVAGLELPFDWRRRYRVCAPLGAGGMAEVWSARHLPTGRMVAIKKLRQTSGSLRGEAAARLLLEGRSACAIRHPHVVELFDFVEPAGEAPFLVMELLDGETLETKLAREGALSVEATARLLLPVVSAVGTAHCRGIVHRDLKPANVFLCARSHSLPWVKVLDFGIAKWVEAQQELGFSTRTGMTLGTPSYMAPEQALAQRDIDHRADVWSLGVMMYECLSGTRPLEGDNAAQLMMSLMSSGITPLEAIAADLPAELCALVRRMLARERERRPQDLREVFELLGGYCEHAAPPFGAPSSEPAACDDLTSLSALAAPPRRFELKRRVRRPVLVVAATVLAAGGLLAAMSHTLVSEPPRALTPSTAAAPLQGGAPLLIDDFEDLDGVPDAASFSPWQWFVYNGEGRAGFSAQGPGHNGTGSLILSWHVVDTPNGRADHAGAGLRTLARGALVNLSSFSRLVFSHRHEPGLASSASTSTCHPIAEFIVYVTCPEYETQYETRVPVSERWRTTVLQLSELAEPEWRGPTGTPLRSCLAVAEALNFAVQATLSDGECSTGRLWLDRISLR